jgi:nucleoid DNA-binding protein
MTPAKANDFIPEVAEMLGMDESLARSILNQFWGMVYAQLEAGSDSRVNVDGLGKFIAGIKDVGKLLTTKKAQGTDINFYTNRTVNRLEVMRIEIMEQNEAYKQSKKLRRIIYSGSTETLEEPEIDI